MGFTSSHRPALAVTPGVSLAGLRDALLPVVSVFWLALLMMGRERALLHVVAAVPLLAYVAYLVRTRRLPGPTPFDWWTCGLIGVVALTVFLAVDPRISAEVALSRAAAVLYFYFLYDTRAVPARLVFRTFLFVGLLASLSGLLSIAVQYKYWLDSVHAVAGSVTTADLLPSTLPRVSSGVFQPNALAKLLNLCLPIALVFAFKSQTKSDRLLGVASLAAGLVAMFFTLSRAGWMGSAAGLGLLGAFLVAGQAGAPQLSDYVARLRSRAPWLIGSAVAVTVAIAAVSAIVLKSRPIWLFRDTISTRIDSWEIALRIIHDNWLIGAGPASYFTLYDRYRGNVSALYPDAHNVYLTLFSEVGLIGSVLVLLGGAVLMRALFKAWSSGGNSKPYIAAVIAGIVATLVHGMASFMMGWSTLLIPLAILTAVALQEAPIRSVGLRVRVHDRLKWLPRAMVVMLVPLVLAIWFYSDRAESDYSRSLDFSPAATQAAVSAAEKDPQFWAYQMHAGVSLVQLYQMSLEAGSPDANVLSEGIRFLRKAEVLAPDQSLVGANLALALRIQGDRDGSVAAARRSLSRSPLSPSVYTVAGTTFEWAGLEDEAINAYAIAIDLDPSLSQAPFWGRRSPELRAQVLEQANVDACLLARYAALYGVYTDDLPR